MQDMLDARCVGNAQGSTSLQGSAHSNFMVAKERARGNICACGTSSHGLASLSLPCSKSQDTDSVYVFLPLSLSYLCFLAFLA